MQTVLKQLGREHWPELYRLMVARGFPSVPARYVEAKPYFESVKVLGLIDGSELTAGFVFGQPEDGIAYFDVVCSRNTQSLWATRAVLCKLFDMAFGKMKLRCIWVQVHSKKALRAALQAGFVPATQLDAKVPVLVMTPGTLPGWMKKRKQERE